MEFNDFIQLEFLIIAGVAGIAGAFAMLRQQVTGMRRDVDRLQQQVDTQIREGMGVRENLTQLNVLVAEIRDDIRELKGRNNG